MSRLVTVEHAIHHRGRHLRAHRGIEISASQFARCRCCASCDCGRLTSIRLHHAKDDGSLTIHPEFVDPKRREAYPRLGSRR